MAKNYPVHITIALPGLSPDGAACDIYTPKRILLDARINGEENSELGLSEIIGQLLYIALTGHAFGQHPHSAHSLIAAQARYLIESRAGQSKEYLLAHQVLVDWGLVYQPWLGVLGQDAEGQVVESHPCYHYRLPLPGVSYGR